MALTPIDQAAELQPYLQRLKALGYTNTDQLIGANDAAASLLAEYLTTSQEALKTIIDRLPRRERAVAFAAMAAHPRRLGVRLDRIPAPSVAFAVAPAPVVPLPATINLVSQMRPIRDQGDRGTCVAHASTAAAEQYFHGKGKIVDLSRQYLYWDCKTHDGDPNSEGTWIAIAMPRLQQDGCCIETKWPYNPKTVPGNESEGPPPAGAATEGHKHKIPGFVKIAPTSVHDIKAQLALSRCVAFSIPVFDSWYKNDEVTLTGDIINPIPGEKADGGHALCMVGYEDMPSETALGGGRFYLRNSWDSAWGTSCTLGVGYGTIPYSYIARFGSEAFSIG